MPQHVRFLARHATLGASVAVLFLVVLIGLDIGRVGTALPGSSAEPFAALAFLVGLTLASAQMGIVRMGLERNEGGSGPRRRERARVYAAGAELVPVRVRARP